MEGHGSDTSPEYPRVSAKVSQVQVIPGGKQEEENGEIHHVQVEHIIDTFKESER